MRKNPLISLLIAFIILTMMACGITTNLTDTLNPELKGETPVEPTSESLSATAETENPLLNTAWQWSSLTETDPASLSIVPDPQNYLLILYPDNRFQFKADCNQGNGEYVLQGTDLTLILGASTLAECGPESLYDQYIRLLGQVIDYEFRDGSLYLGLANDAGEIGFANGGPVQPPQEAEVDSEQALTTPKQTSGAAVGDVTLNIGDLPYSIYPEQVPSTAYDKSNPNKPLGLPDHVRLSWISPEEQGAETPAPSMYIIPIEPYLKLWEEAGDTDVSNQLSAIQDLLAQRPDPLPGMGIPALPNEMTGATFNDLAVQGQYLDFPWGSGLRFVGRWSDEQSPVTNQSLQYVFQGITNDGNYLVSFMIPVRTAGLVDDPAQVPQEELDQLETDYLAYLQTRVVQLNALPNQAWEPDLSKLDQAISSLSIQQSAQMESASPPETTNDSTFFDTTWIWVEALDSAGDQTLAAPTTNDYTLRFANDGTLAIQSACNNLSGTYTVNGNAINLSWEPTALAYCGSGSLSPEFLALLDQVETFQLEEERLVLFLPSQVASLNFKK